MIIASPPDFAAPAAENPDKIALALLTLSGAERWSYAKLLAEIERLAQELREVADANTPLPLAALETLETPIRLAAALKAGFTASITSEDGQDFAPKPPDLPLSPQDRVFLAGSLQDPLILRAILAAWAAGATLLCPSPKLAPAQWPILLRRHDVSLIAGRSAQLESLLAANLAPLPKLRASFALDPAQEALQNTWLARMGQGLGQA